MSPKNSPSKPAPRPTPPPTALEQAFSDLRHPTAPRQTVSARWLLSAAIISILAAGLLAWAALCILFAQGNWQLLYHPSSTILRTPASANLDFQTILFAPSDSGVPQLAGWWIPAASDAPYARFTVLYLHSQDGNLSNTIDDLAFLHSTGLNVFAYDYRGYGQSQPAHPSEAHWLQDTTSALTYLTQTRHIPPNAILLDGNILGANLALEFASAHPELAGAILDQPLDAPMTAIFNDPRAALVPAHLLARDRYNAGAAAPALRIPSLWLQNSSPAATQHPAPGSSAAPPAYAQITAPKTLVWLTPINPSPATHSPAQAAQRSAALTRWLDDLSVSPTRP